MTVTLTAFAVLSLVGAATFLAAGAVLQRLRTAAAHGPTLGPHPAIVELARLRAEHEQALADRRRLGDEVARLASVAPAPANPEMIVLRRRLADADELRAENARLRRDVDESGRLATRVAQLEQELAEAVRRSATSQSAIPQGPAPAPTTLAASMATGGLDALVRQLSSDPRFGAAVISDELGLLVAGGGERAEELAAVGGYLAGVGERARQLADLSAPTRIIVEDDRNTTLSAVHLPGGSLVAVTVSRARPDARPPAIPR